MLLTVGLLVVFLSTLGGFMVAGGNPGVLMHLSEFIVIGGVAAGILIIASPKAVLLKVANNIKDGFVSSGISRDDVLDLLKLLYELFLIGRRNGLIALDEHVSDPSSSSIISKYPSFVNDKKRVDFLCNALRPIIDGKIKPDQLADLLGGEIKAMQKEAEAPVEVLHLIGDSLPGVGIIAAVLGIINTMGTISEGPEMVGKKIAAALTGTFLGIFGAYGMVNPVAELIKFNNRSFFQYYSVMVTSISGFAKGLAPIMAIEVARRSLEEDVKPDANELEEMLKSLNAK